LDPSRQLIYCSLGSHPHDYKESGRLFQAVLHAVRQRPDRQLVLAAGHLCLGEPAFQDLPQNVIAVSWVPQLALLEKASLMITHGGLGTVKECIHFGVPMVVFPIAHDQPGNAARIVYHGLGLRGNTNEVSARQILSLVDEVVENPSFRERVGAMSAIFRDIEKSGIGVEVVERILSGVQGSRMP
jgi:MGT family glycosyltransferase